MFLSGQMEIFLPVIWSQNPLETLLRFFTQSPRLNLLAREFTMILLKNQVRILSNPSLKLLSETLFVTLFENLFMILLSKILYENQV